MTEMNNLTNEENESFERLILAMALLPRYSPDYLELIKEGLKDQRKLHNQMRVKFSKLRRSQRKRA